jgi:predicted lipoprotein
MYIYHKFRYDVTRAVGLEQAAQCNKVRAIAGHLRGRTQHVLSAWRRQNNVTRHV